MNIQPDPHLVTKTIASDNDDPARIPEKNCAHYASCRKCRHQLSNGAKDIVFKWKERQEINRENTKRKLTYIRDMISQN